MVLVLQVMLPNGEMGAVVSGGPVEGMLQVLTSSVAAVNGNNDDEDKQCLLNTPGRT